jgi:hypothetical protein
MTDITGRYEHRNTHFQSSYCAVGVGDLERAEWGACDGQAEAAL